MAYIDSMYDVMAMETGMLKSVMAYVKEHCAEELAMLNAEVPEIKEIPTIRFHEAKQIMEEEKELPVEERTLHEAINIVNIFEMVEITEIAMAIMRLSGVISNKKVMVVDGLKN